MTALIKKAALKLEISVYFLCFISLLTALFFNNLSMKIFNAMAILGILTLLLNFRKIKFDDSTITLFSSFLLLGLVNIIWYFLFKIDNSEFRATYHSYLNTSKIFILGSFIVLLASTSKIRISKKIFLYFIYSLSFLLFFISIYIKYNSEGGRIDFGVGTATGAAYSLTFIAILSSAAIFYISGKNLIFYIANITAAFISLFLMETRSSIILLPLICFITVLSFYRNKIKDLIVFFLILLCTLILVGTIFQDTIKIRYYDAVRDIKEYKKNSSNSSIGARFAMQQTGIHAFQYSILTGQSAERRAELINDIIKKDSSLSGAMPFLNVHLHNEIIEASSLKGILGIATTLFLYLSLLFTSYRKKSIPLLGFTLALIGFGLSDVLLWARSIPIIIVTGCVIILLYSTKKNDYD